jgi:hypothetical protein
METGALTLRCRNGESGITGDGWAGAAAGQSYGCVSVGDRSMIGEPRNGVSADG